MIVDDRDLKYSNTQERKLNTTVPLLYWSLLCTSDISDMFTFQTHRYFMASWESPFQAEQIYKTFINFHQWNKKRF